MAPQQLTMGLITLVPLTQSFATLLTTDEHFNWYVRAEAKESKGFTKRFILIIAFIFINLYIVN